MQIFLKKGFTWSRVISVHPVCFFHKVLTTKILCVVVELAHVIQTIVVQTLGSWLGVASAVTSNQTICSEWFVHVINKGETVLWEMMFTRLSNQCIAKKHERKILQWKPPWQLCPTVLSQAVETFKNVSEPIATAEIFTTTVFYPTRIGKQNVVKLSFASNRQRNNF